MAPELHLKRLVVGGFDRVFEINRNFRNEGMSTRHNPEFTMVEFYQAYADYLIMMDQTEALLQYVVKAIEPSGVIEYQGQKIDFNQIGRMSMVDAILHYSMILLSPLSQRPSKFLLSHYHYRQPM